jgi:DnaJ-class molecular chaperone
MSPHVDRTGKAEGEGASDPTRDMAPGDEAPQGTPGAGENICPACGGSGQLQGATCKTCAGTGVVIEEVGGA